MYQFIDLLMYQCIDSCIYWCIDLSMYRFVDGEMYAGDAGGTRRGHPPLRGAPPPQDGHQGERSNSMLDILSNIVLIIISWTHVIKNTWLLTFVFCITTSETFCDQWFACWRYSWIPQKCIMEITFKLMVMIDPIFKEALLSTRRKSQTKFSTFFSVQYCLFREAYLAR